MPEKDRQTTDKNAKLYLCIAILAISVAVVAGLVVWAFHERAEIMTFSPPPFDSEAQQGTPHLPEDSGYFPLSTKDGKEFSVCGHLVAKNSKVDIYFTNNDVNSVYAKCQIILQDGTMLGETGLVKPGEYVQSVTLSRRVPSGTSNAQIRVMTYEPETYHSEGEAHLKTKILNEQ